MQKLLPQILQLKILRPQTAFSLSAANLVWGLNQHAYSVHFGHCNTLSPKIPIQILPTDLHVPLHVRSLKSLTTEQCLKL